MSKQIIEISTWTIVKTILLILGLALLYYVRDVVVILLLSVVIASAIEPGVRVLSNKLRFPRTLAVLSMYILGIAFFALAFYLILPPLIHELKNFVATFPFSLEDTLLQIRSFLSGFLASTPEFVSIPGERIADELDIFLNQNIGQFFSLGASFGSSLFGGALSLVLIIVLSFYFAVQENGIANFLKIVTPNEHEDYVVGLWIRSQRKIGKWLQGQLLLGLMVGIFVYIGLALLGVQYALVLAMLAAIFELIPIFGPIMAAIPSTMIAFIQDPVLGIWVVLLYIIVQQFENHLIYPLVVRKAVGVPPLLVIIALLIGGKLGGFVGFILAVPIVSAIVEYSNDVAKRKDAMRIHAHEDHH